MDSNKEFENIDERIELFLRGKMNAAEADVFRKKLQEDKEVRDRAIAISVLVQSMKNVTSAHDKSVINSIYSKRFIKPIISIMAIAACLCIIFCITQHQMLKNNTYSLATEYISYAPELSLTDNVRGGDEQEQQKIEEHLLSLFNSVKVQKNRSENIKELSDLFKESLSEKVNYYTDYTDYIGYYLAISYLQDNDRDNAIITLKDVLKNNPEFAQAKELLDKITKIKGLW